MAKFLLLLSLICSCAYSLPYPYHYTIIDNDGLITSEVTHDNPEDMKYWADADASNEFGVTREEIDKMAKEDLNRYAVKKPHQR